MTTNQQNWLYVIFVVFAPFLVVHLFPHTFARLMALLWVFSLMPIILTVLLFDPKQIVRLRNYSNPVVDKRITIIVKVLATVLIAIFIFAFTVPIWLGVYAVYVQNASLTVVDDTPTNLGSAVLAPGLFWYVHSTKDPSRGYAYFLPTNIPLNNIRYQFTILPGTNFVLGVQPI
jgi:hypothetical protein